MSRAEEYYAADDRICKHCGHWAVSHFGSKAADHAHMWCTCEVSFPIPCSCGCTAFEHNGCYGRGQYVNRGWCHKHGTCPEHEPTRNPRRDCACTCLDKEYGAQFQDAAGSVPSGRNLRMRCEHRGKPRLDLHHVSSKSHRSRRLGASNEQKAEQPN